MGTGSVFHKDVVKFLNKFGKSKDCKLRTIYSESWDEKWGKKEKSLECDYCNDSSECNAIVDVVVQEGWMETLGKMIAYSYELKHYSKDTEIWLIFHISGKYELEKNFKRKFYGDKNKYISYMKEWYKRLLEISRDVLKPEYSKRIKFYYFDDDVQDLKPIE